MKRQRKKIRIKSQSRNLFILALALCITLLSIGVFTIAKYYTKWQHNNLIEARGFYFTSNYLEESPKIHKVYSESVDITIRNTDGLNTTSFPIDYTLEFTGGILRENGNEVVSGTSHTLDAAHTYTLTPDGTEEITVTATATDPYIQELSGIFKFIKVTEDSYYILKDEGDFVKLDLYLGMSPPDSLEIVYGADLMPDATEPLLTGWTPGSGSVTISGGDFEQYTHYTLYFFESQAATYKDVPMQTLNSGTETIEIEKN